MSDETTSRSSPGYLQALFKLLKEWGPYATHAADSISNDTTVRRPRNRAPSQERRVIVYPEKETTNGRVAAVQAAVQNGWRLVDIDLRTEGKKRRLAFVLHRRHQSF